MEYIAVLYQENLELSKLELDTLMDSKSKLDGNIAIGKTTKRQYNRLAFTKFFGKLLFSCPEDDVKEKMQEFNWNKYYKDSFYFSFYKKSKDQSKSKSYAKYIWRNVKDPKVDVKNPGSVFDIFIINDTAYASLRLWKSEDSFANRKAHLRPYNHPTSLHPKLARALVNITGITKGTLYDPFCGAGGILFEAGLMGIDSVGYDIDDDILKKARVNLAHYGLDNFKVMNKDALTISNCNYIATDLPYGRSSKFYGELYTKFLTVLEKRLKKRAVIIFPDFFDYRKEMKKYKLKILYEFDWYVHRSMTRKIVVLVPKTL